MLKVHYSQQMPIIHVSLARFLRKINVCKAFYDSSGQACNKCCTYSDGLKWLCLHLIKQRSHLQIMTQLFHLCSIVFKESSSMKKAKTCLQQVCIIIPHQWKEEKRHKTTWPAVSFCYLLFESWPPAFYNRICHIKVSYNIKNVL